MICVPFVSRFAQVSELAPVGTPVGTILAAAINQTIFYSIVSGNELGNMRDFVPQHFLPNTRIVGEPSCLKYTTFLPPLFLCISAHKAKLLLCLCLLKKYQNMDFY